MSWQVQQQYLADQKAFRYQLFNGEQALSFADVIKLWQHSHSFCKFYNQLLAGTVFKAFFWELPAVTKHTIDRPFEYVLVESVELRAVQSDAKTFADYFTASGAQHKEVIDFKNLGGDAVLVVPMPVSDQRHYAQLATFVRTAPAQQQQLFWRQLGKCIEMELSSRPLWVNTSGLGVYWLHVRLDQQPKYYSYLPYKAEVFK